MLKDTKPKQRGTIPMQRVTPRLHKGMIPTLKVNRPTQKGFVPTLKVIIHKQLVDRHTQKVVQPKPKGKTAMQRGTTPLHLVMPSMYKVSITLKTLLVDMPTLLVTVQMETTEVTHTLWTGMVMLGLLEVLRRLSCI